MDAATGEVLWERNGTTPLPPASTTKVMTAILALESGRLDEQLIVSSRAAGMPASRINLRAGQRMQLASLVYAALLNSANDAAMVIAEGLAGSEDAFARRMNEKARALGATTAHFTNPHGLSARGHVASARDLARIFRYGLRVPLFREILTTRTTRVKVQSPSVRWVSLRSHNRLLTGHAYPVIGKTGYTRQARRCFVGAATEDGRELVIALLGATDLWGDARRLLGHAVRLVAEQERPAATWAAAAPERYTVQLGPYPSRSAALATRERLVQRGYGAVLSGRHLHVGSFTDRARAQRFASRLESTGYRPVVVAPGRTQARP
jgi:D-alanyl-D-alanine carboxypeptidase (penicillin-binding protein 5/6)